MVVSFLLLIFGEELLLATLFLVGGIVFNEMEKTKDTNRTVIMPKKPTKPPNVDHEEWKKWLE